MMASSLPLVATESNSVPVDNGAKIVFENGRPRLQIDGKTVFENLFVTDATRFTLDVLPDLEKAGYKVVAVTCYTHLPSKYNIPDYLEKGGPLWVGKDQYDWTKLDARMAEIEAKAPGLKVVLYLALYTPFSWMDEHPEEAIGYETPYIPGENEMNNFGVGGASVASEAFKKDASEFLKKLISHIDTQSYRSKIVGFNLVGGDDGQWMHRGIKQGKFDADYGPSMKRYFISYLRAKYGNDKGKLQTAWGKEGIDFDTAQMPEYKRRDAMPASGFRDPKTQQDVLDYTEAFCLAPLDIIQHLARTVKEASNGTLLTLTYTGSSVMDVSNYSQTLGRFFQRQLLASPYLDGLVGVSYQQRPIWEPGGLGFASGSFHLHNKLAIQEEDIRPFHTPEEGERKDPHHGWTAEWSDQRSMFIREFARTLTAGIGRWDYDMPGRWYNRPEFMDLFTRFNAIGDEELKKTFQSTSQVAVVVDDLSQIYRPINDRLLQYHSISVQKTNLGWMGAPYDTYLLSDITDENVKAYKCYVFLNTYRIDGAERERIHAMLAKNGATALWLYAPGVISDSSSSAGNIEKLTGFKVKRLNSSSGTVSLRELDNPLLNGIQGKALGDLRVDDFGSYEGPFYCPEETEGVMVLGDMKAANAPGLAVRQMEGWRSIYVSPTLLSPEFLRNMLRSAGGFLYSDDVSTGICANSNYLSLFARSAGSRTIKIPVKASLEDLFSGEILPAATEFQVDLKANEARLYAIREVKP